MDIETLESASTPQSERKPWQFSPDNARKMAARSHELRRQRAAQRQDDQPTTHADTLAGEYVAMRLARTRSLIEGLELDLGKAKDAQEKERLARSLTTMSELERVLAGRASPGSYRPREPKQGRQPDVEPL